MVKAKIWLIAVIFFAWFILFHLSLLIVVIICRNVWFASFGDNILGNLFCMSSQNGLLEV